MVEFDAKYLRAVPNLKHFRIRKSQLKSIKLNYKFLANLETISLERNMLESVDLRHLVNLKSLDLSFNSRLILEGEPFGKLVKLEELYLTSIRLSSTKLVSIKFAGLKNLRLLDLSNNFLINLELKTFRGLESLRELDLRRNKVKSDTQMLFKVLPKLQNLQI